MALHPIHAHPKFKLGRTQRKRNPRIPHMSALLAGRQQPAPQPVDYSTTMPDSLGMMLNDQIGDCTVAGMYHGIQVWTFNTAGNMLTEPDSMALRTYETIDGYDPDAGPPGENPTDQGGNEQDTLTYWLNTGIPLAVGGPDKCLAFVEIDPTNDLHINQAIADCGFVYIGFNVPAFLMPPDGDIPALWDVSDGDNTIIGGHCVILPGFQADNTRRVISWGSKGYQMTSAFFQQFVDEVYCIADNDWINAKGTTPANLSKDALLQQMQALRSR